MKTHSPKAVGGAVDADCDAPEPKRRPLGGGAPREAIACPVEGVHVIEAIRCVSEQVNKTTSEPGRPFQASMREGDRPPVSISPGS
jgi:hypothetical protein